MNDYVARALPNLPLGRAPRNRLTLLAVTGQARRWTTLSKLKIGGMMLHNTFGSEAIEAGAELLAQFDKTFPVRTAFWIKFEDEWRWQLCIASDRFNHSDVDDRYGEIIRITNASPTPFLDPVQVKPIPTDDRLAQEAIFFHQRYPGRRGTRLGSGAFGGREIEGIYIYPSPIAAPVG